jgi:hypothetical protein
MCCVFSAHVSYQQRLGRGCRSGALFKADPSRIRDDFVTGVPTRESDSCRICYPSFRKSILQFLRVYPCDKAYQAVQGIDANYDALVDLLETIEHFLNRLNIYTTITPTASLAEVISKIMVELLSTLAVVTKHVKLKRPSEPILTDMLCCSSECKHSETHQEAFGRE